MIFDYLPAVPRADHYYPFLGDEETDNKAVQDMGKSENKFCGEVRGSGEVLRTSKGFEFNGKNQIDFGKELGAFGKQDFTVALWNRTTTDQPNSAILSNHVSGSHGNFLSVRFQSGFFCVELDDNRVDNYCMAHSRQEGHKASNDGKWHQLVVIRKAEKMMVLLDGEVMAEKEASKGEPIDIIGRCHLVLGSTPCANYYDLQYSGFVAELMVWKGLALSVDVARHLFTCQAPHYHSSE